MSAVLLIVEFLPLATMRLPYHTLSIQYLRMLLFTPLLIVWNMILICIFDVMIKRFSEYMYIFLRS